MIWGYPHVRKPPNDHWSFFVGGSLYPFLPAEFTAAAEDGLPSGAAGGSSIAGKNDRYTAISKWTNRDGILKFHGNLSIWKGISTDFPASHVERVNLVYIELKLQWLFTRNLLDTGDFLNHRHVVSNTWKSLHIPSGNQRWLENPRAGVFMGKSTRTGGFSSAMQWTSMPFNITSLLWLAYPLVI